MGRRDEGEVRDLPNIPCPKTPNGHILNSIDLVRQDPSRDVVEILLGSLCLFPLLPASGGPYFFSSYPSRGRKWKEGWCSILLNGPWSGGLPTPLVRTRYLPPTKKGPDSPWNNECDVKAIQEPAGRGSGDEVPPPLHCKTFFCFVIESPAAK